jgi:hypothetical protein
MLNEIAYLAYQAQAGQVYKLRLLQDVEDGRTRHDDRKLLKVAELE